MNILLRTGLTLGAILFTASIMPAAPADTGRPKLATVVIDPGHGGHDSGCVSTDKKTYEKSLTLDISRRLSEKIAAAHPGVKVVLTRFDDTYVTLSGRADIANNIGADLFISIHINAQEKGTQASGYSIHCLGQSSKKGNDLFSKNLELCKRENSVILLEDDYKTKYQGFDPSDPQSYIFFSLMQNAHLEQSLQFASDIAESLRGGPIQRNRGVSQDPFWVLWRTTMPSVLVELGFITNPADLQALRSEQDRERIAGQLLKAFTTFKQRYENRVEEEEAPEVAPDAKAAQEPAAGATKDDGIQYGIQVLATSRRMKAGDPFFKGYPFLELTSGKLYKYILLPVGSLDQARRNFKEVGKKYPESFLVRVEQGSTTRIR